jgi:hypothetical protein
MHLVKSESHNTLQRRLRARISTYWSRPDANAEGLAVLRTLDGDIVRRERDLRERSALVLREFGYGFGLSNGHVQEVLRWYTQVAMHYLMTTLEAADISDPQTSGEFFDAVQSLPAFRPEPTTAAWWKIADPVQVRVHHQDQEGRYHQTARVIVPRTALRVREAEIAKYPGVGFKGAFEFDALPRYVLPQLVHGATLGTSWSPASWDEERLWLWEDND